MIEIAKLKDPITDKDKILDPDQIDFTFDNNTKKE